MKTVCVKRTSGLNYFIPLDQNPLLGAHDVKTCSGTLRCAFGAWIPDGLVCKFVHLVSPCDSKYIQLAQNELAKMVDSDAVYNVNDSADHFSPEYEALEEQLAQFIGQIEELAFT